VNDHTVRREQDLDLVFHALADATRREILRRLSSGELTVGQVANRFPMSLAAVSKHLQVLENAGLLTKTRRGRTAVCSIDLKSLEEADAAIRGLAGYWEDRLDELEDYLTGQTDPKRAKGEPNDT
jgi:DNA-binding transcriptional ArsR family regulator